MSLFAIFVFLVCLDLLIARACFPAFFSVIARRSTPNPAQLAQAALISWLLGLSAFAIFATIQIRNYQSPNLKAALTFGIAQALCIAVLRLASKKSASFENSPNVMIALWSAFLSFPLVATPMVLAISRNPLSEIQWNAYGFLDKRWLFAAYVTANFGLILIPSAIARLLRGTRPQIQSPEPTERKHLIIAVLLFLAWWCWGPPWHVADYSHPLELHELVHLGGMQAIHLGRIPYAHAQVQYGPGLQLLSYLYMKLTGFDLLHLRESNVLFNFVAAALVFSGFAVLLRPSFAMGAALFSIVSVSPFAAYQFESHRIMGGAYGSTNPWRYLGIFALITLVHLNSWRNPGSRRRLLASFLIGAVWGIFTWISQENLAGGITALGIYTVLIACAGPLRIQVLAANLGTLALGFFVPWLFVIGYYSAHGSTALFFQNYFMVSGLVARGYSNSEFLEKYWQVPYYATPYLAWAAAIFAMFNPKTGRFFDAVNEQCAVVLAGVAALLGSYQNSLFRSDGGHYILTTLALPLVIFGSLQILPETLGWQNRDRRTHSLRWALFLIVTLIYPIKIPDALNPIKIGHLFASVPPSASLATADSSLGPAAQRLGIHYSIDNSCCHSNSASYRAFINQMKLLRNFCGDRPTVVDSFVDFNGYVYFFADLMPALDYTENHHFLLNSIDQKKYERLLANTDYRCAIGMDSSAPVFTHLKAKHPSHEETTFTFDGKVITAVRADF